MFVIVKAQPLCLPCEYFWFSAPTERFANTFAFWWCDWLIAVLVIYRRTQWTIGTHRICVQARQRLCKYIGTLCTRDTRQYNEVEMRRRTSFGWISTKGFTNFLCDINQFWNMLKNNLHKTFKKTMKTLLTLCPNTNGVRLENGARINIKKKQR